jgi:lactoylglutathione lyase
MKLALVVIKTNQLEQAIQFYQALGFAFQEEKHGNGVNHYSTQIDDTVFEIYPLPASATSVDTTTRLGFRINQLVETINRLKEMGIPIVKSPVQMDWVYLAIVKYVDGRIVELYQK